MNTLDEGLVSYHKRQLENLTVDTPYRLHDIVYLRANPGHVGVITEIFPYVRSGFTSLGRAQVLHHVRYINGHGQLVTCPDFERCQHQHTCPLHGTNAWVEQLELMLPGDLDYYVREGFIARELFDRMEQRAPLNEPSLASFVTGLLQD